MEYCDAIVEQFMIIFSAPDEFKALYDQYSDDDNMTILCSLDPWNAVLHFDANGKEDNVNKRFTATNLMSAEGYQKAPEVCNDKHRESGYWTCVTDGLLFMPCDFVLSELKYYPPTITDTNSLDRVES